MMAKRDDQIRALFDLADRKGYDIAKAACRVGCVEKFFGSSVNGGAGRAAASRKPAPFGYFRISIAFSHKNAPECCGLLVCRVWSV
jgi:hypothetical protein